MNHPSEEWKDEATFPWELKSEKLRFLDRDIRFKGITIGDSEDYWRCLRWELFRTIAFCKQMPQSFDTDREFPFYIRSFPSRSYLSHKYEVRGRWERFIGQTEHKDDERLLSPLGMKTQIHNYYPSLINKEGETHPSTQLSQMRVLRRKLGLELFINPNWTQDKLKRLFEKQIKEIYEEIQAKKKFLEKSRKVVPFVHVDFKSSFTEKKFRQEVQRQTDEVCSLMTNGRNYFKTKPDIFEGKKTTEIPQIKSLLKHLGHFRLRHCVKLSWKETRRLFGTKDIKALVSEKNFETKIRRYFTGLSCN
jgi:hypothetical protein